MNIRIDEISNSLFLDTTKMITELMNYHRKLNNSPKEYRGNGIGKLAMKKLDELMVDKKVISMFVDVIPRNTGAIKLYKECGFDHLNIIQLRKTMTKD